MSQLLASALWYAAHGWHVFPLSPRSKVPLANTRGFKDATTDPETIRGWWQNHPEANIGIAAGASGLVIVDVDVKHDAPGMESWLDLRQQFGETLEETCIAETPTGGMHVFYLANGQPVRNSAGQLGPGIDIRANGGYVAAAPSIVPGGEYVWAAECSPKDRPPSPWPKVLADLLEEKTGRSTPRIVKDVIPHGTQHYTLFSLAGTMRRRGMGVDAIEAALWIENQKRCEVPASRENIRKMAESVCKYAPDPERFPHTDLGNSERFVTQHGETIRFCHSWRAWLVWDGVRWARDTNGLVLRMARDTVRSIYLEAAGTDDADMREAIAKHAKASERESRIRSMLALAESESRVAITAQELDTNPWLLNCKNGTVDLRTGQVEIHERQHLITKLAPVTYNPDAQHDLWDRFLAESTGDDEELIAFLQRAMGYTLTGDASEEKLFFVHGPTNTGKSTFLEAFKAALGDYAVTADFETFLSRSFVGSPRPDIARLNGARFVASIEVDEGKKLAEGLIKQLTGGDTITARFLYSPEFEFMPQFKLWLAANHAPHVSHEDAAIWRRILKLPFEVTVPKEKRDPQLKVALKSDPQAQSAILAWAVRGCVAWQEMGLAVPVRVERATEEYRLEQDPLREFILTCCALSPDVWAEASDIRSTYESWCRESGETPINGRAWAQALRAHGCEPKRRRVGGKGTRGWQGIGLVAEDSDDAGAYQDDIPF